MAVERITRPVPFSLKLSDDEAKALEEIAKIERRPAQEMIRELIRERALLWNVWPQPEPTEEEVQLAA